MEPDDWLGAYDPLEMLELLREPAAPEDASLEAAKERVDVEALVLGEAPHRHRDDARDLQSRVSSTCARNPLHADHFVTKR